MKIAYLYFNDLKRVELEENVASVNQILNMVHQFGRDIDVYFISSFIRKKDFHERLKSLDLNQNFNHIKLFVPFTKSNKFLEFLLRSLYSIQSLIILRLLNVKYIYTRDFSFIYLLSQLPNYLRPKQKIIYEPHKIYHKSTDKVSFPQEIKALKIPNLFIPVSSGVKKDLIEIFKIDEKKIFTSPNGVNLDLFKKLPDKVTLRLGYGIKKSEKIIIYSGSFVKWKGVEFLVESYSKFLNKSKNSKLFLIGGSKEDIKRIKQLIKDLHVDKERIILTGFMSQKNLIKFLKMADIGVIPNIKTAVGNLYTCPLKAYEYMAAGLAIAAPNTPSMKETLGKDNAVFFESENKKDLANKLNNLLKDRKKMNQMQEYNQRKVINSTWDYRAKEILARIQNSS
jgi:glycosyltransferase involved in cell wall biosynthesis